MSIEAIVRETSFAKSAILYLEERHHALYLQLVLAEELDEYVLPYAKDAIERYQTLLAEKVNALSAKEIAQKAMFQALYKGF